MVGAVLATLLAIHWGFRAVVIAALGLYAAAGVAFGRLTDDRTDAAPLP